MRLKKSLSRIMAVMIAVIIALAGTIGLNITNRSVLAADTKIITDVAAPKLTAVKNEDNNIVLSWVAQDDTDLDGFSGKLSLDHNTFYYTEDDLSNTGLTVTIAPSSDIVGAIESTKRIIYQPDQAIFTLTLHVLEGASLEPGKDYEFTFKLNDDAYTFDLDDYNWADELFTATYHEEDAITFTGVDGSTTKITRSVIESCSKTSRDNYLLKDVLAAAGVGSAALGDCRYIFKGADDEVYLDADLIDDLALWIDIDNGNGIRSTLEGSHGELIGTWFKIKNLESITTENHNPDEATCTNELHTGEKKVVKCSDEPEVEEVSITFTGTDGKTVEITQEILEECDLTAKNNYLFKDVLDAVGVGSDAYAECRYVITAQDGTVVYIDADYFDDFALYLDLDNHAGIRSTFENVPSDISGGWYRLKNVATIKAENHSYVNASCANILHTGKKDEIVCGEYAETVFEFIGTDGESVEIDGDIVRSVESDENGHYALKDVLEAAGVSNDVLGDCSYTVVGAGDFTTIFDADDFDNISLYFDGSSLRSFLEPSCPGWQRVSGIVTITAKNHSYKNGVCENPITVAKQTTEPCGEKVETVFEFIGTDGKSVEIDGDLIRSVDADENGHYALKDVLEAAGVSSDVLGDCRYVITGGDDNFTVAIDADNFDSLALFLSGVNLRNVVENGSLGSWHKVTGIKTITAENHKYEDCVCTNEINVKRVDTVPCGDSIHKLTKTDAVDADCENDGNSEYWTCSVCGKYFSDAEGKSEIEKDSWVIPALGHKLEKTEAVAETCTEDGNSEYWTCSVCGKYYSDAEGKNEIEKDSWVIPALGHKLEKTEAVAADCENDGNSEYWTCSVCGKYFSDEEGKNEIEKDSWVIPALGHKLVKTEAVAETCTEDGNSEYWTCSVCGKYFSDADGKNEIEKDSWIIPAGHKLEKTEAVAADCENDGNSEYWTCSVCGKYFSDANGKTEVEKDSWVIPALGHKLEKTEAVAADCENDGNSEYWTCSVCVKNFSDAEGKTEIEKDSWVIPALGHKLEKTEAVAETCTEDGNSEYWTCSVCGKYFSDAEGKNEIEKDSWIIPAGHDWDEGIVTKEATTEEEGIITYTCKRDPSHTKTETIPKIEEPETEEPSSEETTKPSEEEPTDAKPETMYQIKISETIDVTSALAAKGLTAESIRTKIVNAVISGQTDLSAANTVILEVDLMVSTDGGKTWKPAEADDYPVTVVLPYPEKASDPSKYDYRVAHMFAEGEKAGEVEIVGSTETANGLRVSVSSMSPFAISWKETKSADKPADTKPASGTRTQETTKSPNTGDSNHAAAYIIMMVLAAAVMTNSVVIAKRRKNNR